MKVLVVGGGGREHAIVRALARSPQQPELLCAPGNAGIAADARCLPIAADDVEGLLAAAREEGVGPRRRRARGTARRGARRPARGGGHPRLRPERRGGAARGLEAVRERGDGGGRRADRRARDAARPRAGARRARQGEPPGRAQGRRPGGGQGRDHRHRRGRGGGAIDVFFTEQRFGETEVVLEEFLGRLRAVAARALRRHQRRPARPGPGLQADLRRRRGPEHRRHGQLLAGSGHQRRADRGDRRRRPRADRATHGRARLALPRRALRRADDHRRRPQGARVQHPLRRPRDAGRAAAAAL